MTPDPEIINLEEMDVVDMLKIKQTFIKMLTLKKTINHTLEKLLIM